jgi:RecF/RecN/SMC N terminal domain
MGITEEPTAASADHVEQSVHDVILEMLEQDPALDAAVKDAVLDALAEVVGHAQDNVEAPTAPTFLTSISVVGFRGIGRQARLDLYPAAGLMVVSGRNGSGKSSFAEALELALTGTSYRWHKKETLWAESWQNLHHPDPCAIRVGFTAEGTGPFTVGMHWAPGAALTERASWTQAGSEQRVDGTDHLGWARPLELWRPVLSYDELGRVFDGGPSALYDALAKLLGLEVLADAEKWLAAQLKSTKAARERADDERKRLLTVLANSADERAQRATALMRKKGAVLDEVLALATGSDDAGLQVAPALRALTQLDTPTLDEIDAAAARLRAAAQAVAATTGKLVDSTRQRVDLLQTALRFHDHAGDSECPVCGQGRLDSEWAARTRDTIASTEEALGEYRAAATELTHARSAATNLLTRLHAVDEVAGVELPALTAYNQAVATVQTSPDDDTELAAHLETALIVAADAADTLRTQAGDALKLRESTWAPLAAQLGGWVPMEDDARALDGTLKTMTAAKKWMTDHAVPFRNLRLEPIAAQARNIWGQLRQESNVDLGEITLEGSATRRRAILGGSVDGQPTKALSVMSQGELHALALALFLPRATAANSPFRFVVLDDPIQAMDPAKIDGFVQVLSEIAQTHQVIVFSHDDRLASVIRETGVDARLVQVVREAGSKVSMGDNINPALRQVSDIFALIEDDRLPDEIRARVLPGLFRMAVESAAQQAYYTKQSLAGRPRAEFEEAWMSVKKTLPRLALAVHGDPSADLRGWLDAKPERRPTLGLCNAVHAEAAGVSKQEARELERTVKAVLALR